MKLQNYKRLESCRVSGSADLIEVLNLGTQALTGVFPGSLTDKVTDGPLNLMLCPTSGLLQLGYSYDNEDMYGESYGYRSGLNSSMIEHLKRKVQSLTNMISLKPGDLVLDVGSNDGTLLSCYPDYLRRVGIDPTAEKFREYYTSGVEYISDFFNTEVLLHTLGRVKPKIITSISMFYDLEDPRKFVEDIESILDPTGIWHLEQSYMPSMLRTNSYDTVCHEHLEYYSLEVIKNLVEKAGLKIIDVVMNSINGGSFAITVCKVDSPLRPNTALIDWLIDQEHRMGLRTPRPYRIFEENVYRHREDFVRLVSSLRNDGKTIAGYGASTKGNVLLQFCGFTSDHISSIAEVNKDKFYKYTPGTKIPILPEEQVKLMRPDYLLVLPWHFRDHIIRRESAYLNSGGKLIFPLPEIEIIG